MAGTKGNVVMFKDHPESQREGTKAEKRFAAYCASQGIPWSKSTDYENIYEHFDCRIEWRDRTYKVDVKAIGRVRRHGCRRPDILWLEFQGVKGYEGWLLGEADAIAFEMPDGFMLAHRRQLHQWAETVVQPVWVEHPRDALYKLYRRDGQQDTCTLAKVDDITSNVLHSFVYDNQQECGRNA